MGCYILWYNADLSCCMLVYAAVCPVRCCMLVYFAVSVQYVVASCCVLSYVVVWCSLLFYDAVCWNCLAECHCICMLPILVLVLDCGGGCGGFSGYVHQYTINTWKGVLTRRISQEWLNCRTCEFTREVSPLGVLFGSFWSIWKRFGADESGDAQKDLAIPVSYFHGTKRILQRPSRR